MVIKQNLNSSMASAMAKENATSTTETSIKAVLRTTFTTVRANLSTKLVATTTETGQMASQLVKASKLTRVVMCTRVILSKESLMDMANATTPTETNTTVSGKLTLLKDKALCTTPMAMSTLEHGAIIRELRAMSSLPMVGSTGLIMRMKN